MCYVINSGNITSPITVQLSVKAPYRPISIQNLTFLTWTDIPIIEVSYASTILYFLYSCQCSKDLGDINST